MTITAIESIIFAAMSNTDCVSARYAFRAARTAAREMAAGTNDPDVLDALRNIEAVTTMGLSVAA